MKKKILAIMIALGIILFGAFSLSKEKTTTAINVEDPVFWVLTDNHLIDKSLYDDGEEFQRIKKTAAGKELEYQEESIQALVDSAITGKPTGIIITGDLTLNGEKKSAEKLAELLEPLEENGILCYVIPGNHDINDGWARKFEGKKAIRTEQISPSDFKSIFEMSYNQSVDQDKESLSYLVEINPNLQFLMLDTNIYGIAEGTSSPVTGGKVKDSTFKWIEKHLKEGKEKKKQTIVFMHHNLLQHNELINEGFVIDNAPELRKLLSSYDVPLVFSGHTHSQGIKTDHELGLTEIVSASYAITEQTYGEVTFRPDKINYEKKRVDVDNWAKNQQLANQDILNYRQFTKDLFIDDGRKMAYVQLIENGLYEDEPLDTIAYFVGDANWRYFTGNNDMTEAELNQLKKEKGYQLMEEESPFLQKYMDSILTFKEESNAKIEINLDK